ncbi:MAG: hypothetical protein M0Z78_08940 [Betaproteobacteria bacterium]|nr:hypothetical protein [Betaproteobacteria bacterium]
MKNNVFRNFFLAIAFVFAATPAFASPLGEVKEWLQAASYAIVCHESGHAMAGADVGWPVEMIFDDGGPHYMTDTPVFVPNPAYILQYKTNYNVAQSWVLALEKGTTPPVSFQEAMRAESLEDVAAADLLKEYSTWVSDTNRKFAYVAGAGFVGQQTCESKLSGSIKSKYLAFSGIFYKLGYALFPHSLQPGTGTGDVEAFGGTGSRDIARVSVAISGLADVYRAAYDPDSRWSVGFYRSIDGQPGLQFNYTF